MNVVVSPNGPRIFLKRDLHGSGQIRMRSRNSSRRILLKSCRNNSRCRLHLTLRGVPGLSETFFSPHERDARREILSAGSCDV